MPLGLAGLVDLFEHADVDAARCSPRTTRSPAAARCSRRCGGSPRSARPCSRSTTCSGSTPRRRARCASRCGGSTGAGRRARHRARLAGAGPARGGRDAAARPLRDDRARPARAAPRCAACWRGVVEAISRPALRRIHEVSGGNPLYAIELAAASPPAPARHPAGLPLPDSLQAAIAHRLETVATSSASCSETPSALGPRRSASCATRCPARRPDALLARAERQGLLVVDDDLRVRFSHPLIGSVVYGRMTPLARRALHARLAAAAATPTSARAISRSPPTSPSARVAQLLEDAAARARGAGPSDLAADFAGHASGSPRPATAARALRRALAEIEDRAAAGEVRRALALADAARRAARRPAPRAPRRCSQRAYLEDDRSDDRRALLREALEDAGDDAPLRARVLDQLGWALAMFRATSPAGSSARARRSRWPSGPATRSCRCTSRRRSRTWRRLGGRAAAGPDGAGGGARGADRHADPVDEPAHAAGGAALWAGDLASRARAVRRRARRAPSARARRAPARTACSTSRWSRAPPATSSRPRSTCARGSRRRATPRTPTPSGCCSTRSRSSTPGCGRADEARAPPRGACAEAAAEGRAARRVRARGVLGLLALVGGRRAPRPRELRAAAALLDAMGFAHPGAFPVLPDAVEALARAATWTAPAALLARLERQARAVDSAWARAAPTRSRGACCSPRGDADAAVRAARARGGRLRRGSATAPTPPAPSSCAAGRCCAAAVATPPPTRSPTRASASRRWARRSGRRAPSSELERAAPGRTTGELTPAERRIAALVPRACATARSARRCS